MAFRDIIGKGHRSSSNLAGQFEFFETREHSRHTVHFLPESPRFLVSQQIFKRFELLSDVVHTIQQFNSSTIQRRSNSRTRIGLLKPAPSARPCTPYREG